MFSAMRLQEFVLTKPVCELIDFEFDPVLIKLSSLDYPDICKLVLQGTDLNFSRHWQTYINVHLWTEMINSFCFIGLNEIGTTQQTLFSFVKSLKYKYNGSTSSSPTSIKTRLNQNDTKYNSNSINDSKIKSLRFYKML